MDDDKTRLFVSFFEEVLTHQEAHFLLSMLNCEHHLISKEKVDYAKSYWSKRECLRHIFIEFKDTRKWKTALKSSLEFKLSRQDLKAIFSAAIEPPNQHVIWILSEWSKLCGYEVQVRDMAWLISAEQLPQKKWLESFTLRIIAYNNDKWIVESVCDILKEKMSPEYTASHSMFFTSSGSYHAAEIKQLLVPLIPLLSQNMGLADVKSVISYLRHKEHFVKAKKVKGNTNEGFQMLINTLLESAKMSWKEDILDALRIKAGYTVYFVAKKCLFDATRSETFKWLIANWDSYVGNKELFLKAAQQALGSLPPDIDIIGVLQLSMQNEVKAVKLMSYFQQNFETIGQNLSDKLQDVQIKSINTPLPGSDSEDEASKQSATNKDKSEETLSQNTVVKTEQEVESVKNESTTIENTNQMEVDGTEKSGHEPIKKLRLSDHPEPMEQQMSYAQAANGSSQLNKMQQIKEEDYKVSIKPNDAPDFKFDHYFNHSSISNKGQFMLEFHVVTVPRLEEGQDLYVYIEKDRTSYPMHFDPKEQIYKLVYNEANFKVVYKYMMIAERNTVWEFLPARYYDLRICNRLVTIKGDALQQRHMVTFDVVQFRQTHFHEYEGIYSGNMPRLLPSFSMISCNETQGMPLHVFSKIYNDWFASVGWGQTIVKQFGMDGVNCHLKANDFGNFLGNQFQKYNMLPMQRVLGTLVYVTAMKLNLISPDSKDLRVLICNCLSLHDITEEQQNLIQVQLSTCYDTIEHFNSDVKSTLKKTLKNIFMELYKEPECLLFLPIYSLAMTAMDASNLSLSNDIKFPPNTHWTSLRTEFRYSKYQRSLMEMAEKIVAVSVTFPKMRELYQEVLSPKAVSDLFSKDKRFQQLFDTEAIFKKLLCFWGNTYENQDSNREIVSSLTNFLLTFFHDQSSQLETAVETDTDNAPKWLTLTTQLVNKMKNSSLPPICFALTFGVVSHMLRYCLSLNVKFSIPDEHKLKTAKSALLDSVSYIFNKVQYQSTLNYSDIELWNFLTIIQWNDDFKEEWISKCMEAMHKVIPKVFVRSDMALLEFYADEFDKLQPGEIVAKCFTAVVTEQVEKNVQGSSARRFFSNPLDFFKPKVLKVFERIFMNQWFKHNADAMDSDEIVVQFLFKWIPASVFLRPLATKQVKKSLDTDCKSAVKKCKHALLQMVLGLQKGTILISSLEKFVSHKEDFVTAYNAFSKENKSNVDPQPTEISLKLLIDYRLKELDHFRQICISLQIFLDSASSIFKSDIFSDSNELQSILSSDNSTKPLCHMMACELVRTHSVIPTSPAPLTVFQLSEEVQQEICNLQSSKAMLNTFIQQKISDLWKERITRNDESEKIDLATFLHVIWSPVRIDLLNTLQSIDNGSISIFEACQVLQGVKRANIREVLEKLYQLYKDSQTQIKDLPDLENLGKTTYRLTTYKQLMESNRQAVSIDALRDKLGLKPFDELKHSMMIARNCQNNPLSSMTKELVTTIHQLKSISNDMDLVIEACVNHIDLIKWLKENMKSFGEVQVMSDLAMISAGETPMEVDRVSCFLSAVMGFSPLIFDLPPDAGWESFFNACKEVESNVQKDDKLLAKWDATADQLEWLKTTKDLHGSVEKSSLKRARLINLKGMYIIGAHEVQVPEIEDCLKLKIPKQESKDKEGGSEKIEMTFSELRDLQSRLMLIAGEAEKGKQEVNRFTAVLSVIEKLTKAYIKIRSSGCLLFSNWRADIRCNDSDGGATVLVYFDDKTPAISSSEKVIPEVQNLTTVLEKAHNEWLAYLNEKRCTHYHLSHYNIHQLTYLCKNLANSEDIEDFPDQVYCLLESVLPNASNEDVIDALDEATRIKDDVDMDSDEPEEEDEPESMIERKSKLVRQLVQGDLEEGVAKAAVQAAKRLDLDECYLWALEHFDDENVQDLQDAFDQEVGFGGNMNKIGVVKDVIKDKLDMTLKEVIEHIQKDLDDECDIRTFVNTICERYLKGTSVTSLSDCISLEHLGVFLYQLGISHRDRIPPYREWTEQFIPGKPNLIICPPNAVWRTILSIYAMSPDQPLPSASEVLVCSETTTADHVELLLRRAIGTNVDDGQRIYCLACADLLTFTAAKEVEQVFQQLLQRENHNDEYRLVVIASSAQHYISTCFDEHQVAKAQLSTEIELKAYVEKHLQVPERFEESAAYADDDRSAVRLVYSEQAGNGKSLYVTRRREALSKKFEGEVFWHSTVLRFLERAVDIRDVTTSLLKEGVSNSDSHFVHIDITPSVDSSAQKFLFDLIFLGSIENRHGVMWRRHPNHFYAIEYTQPTITGVPSLMQVLDLVPSVTCLPPLDVRHVLLHGSQEPNNVLMDRENFLSPVFQRPYQYLFRYKNGETLDGFKYTTTGGTPVECLSTLIEFCSIERPSWAEISHFASFLNVQLEDSEKSIFCDLEIMGFDTGLLGFKQFVVRFMIRMSQDFATPSLGTGSSTVGHTEGNDLFELHQLRRRWESGLHPYLFFNDDGAIRSTMSFVHFNISAQGNLCNPVTKEVLEEAVMPSCLYDGLRLQQVSLNQNFDDLPRKSKLETLCGVFGVFRVFDPDPSYELTTDNVLKMLAIHMRFRCNIPVVIMGETGCGKTRMVEFMSKLKAGQGSEIRNMLTIKVHGGITVAVIQDKVRQAVRLAQQNQGVETILFLDEANTTEAIYAIKEVVCDNTVHGQPFAQTGLKIVAACNPYRKHSDEDIRSMENCGLGFNVKTSNIKDKFADIPMRHLVYRVIPLPPSMQPLVWDFGQLNTQTEQIYINQMVVKMVDNIGDALVRDMTEIMTNVLSASQDYMRNTTDVCRFVSLRDVERAIMSFTWFYRHMERLNPMVDKEKQELAWRDAPIGTVLRAFIQALGMCYHTTLQNRQAYREMVARELQPHIRLNQRDILNEIVACQSVFMNAIEVEDDIARNEALRENVFMMIICAEMRIPLFLVGKPGSSKSLAKTIVTKAMQGKNSKGPLFQQLKQIHVSSFQCSAVSDAVGIETMFTQCAQIQSKQDLDKFVAVVVLDEIGLAEDSPKMPLKVLHPLLEVGSTTHTSFDAPKHHKVGFVGISNWALDPAKMNRGIFVTRGEPTKQDLQETAKAFFKSNSDKLQDCTELIKGVTKAYLKVCQEQRDVKEFFGLRDYYGLLKMMFTLSMEEEEIGSNDLALCILRNFSGSERDVFPIFHDELVKTYKHAFRPRATVVDLVRENLISNYESRFLLLLTKQYSAVSFLKLVIENPDFQVIFGSSFPRDHDYTEICRNINRIKVCMESGRTVVLLNLRDLYESLYDALNQQYVTFAGQRYVDLGLGGHRVKCRIATNFKLIVIEEKEVVYNEFPIPLINRLEKHIFEIKSILSEDQLNIVERLSDWVESFADTSQHRFKGFPVRDAFVGYQDDTLASVAINCQQESAEESLQHAKCVLLQTASLDAVVRLPKTNLEDLEEIQQIYSSQFHETLEKMLSAELQFDMERTACIKVFEIMSYSMCLNEQDRIKLEKVLDIQANRIKLITLQQLQTEEEYTEILNDFFDFATSDSRGNQEPVILLIQCPQAQNHSNLIACSKYCAMNKVKEHQNRSINAQIVVAFIFSLERSTLDSTETFTTFHSSECTSIYVDELRPRNNHIAMVGDLWGLTVSEILTTSAKEFLNGANKTLLDVAYLLQVSIPDAMACLDNQESDLPRNRVKVLHYLCDKWKLKQHFVSSLVNLIVSLMKDRERSTRESWIVREACSQTALQEGGSFRNTLWLRLRQLVSQAIAKIISIADGDKNLDLIYTFSQENSYVIDLWIKFFNSQLCFSKWNDVYSKTYFRVVSQVNFTCQFPFSRLIINELSRNWSAIHQSNLDRPDEVFFQKLKSSHLAPLLHAASQHHQMELVERFTHDLIYIIYKPNANTLVNQTKELEVLRKSIMILFAKERDLKDKFENPLLEVFVIFMKLQKNIQLFGEIVGSQNDVLKSSDDWLNQQKKSATFILYSSAFASTIKYLENEAPHIGKVDKCQEWKDLVAKLKHIGDAVTETSSDQLSLSWNLIKFVEIFLDQLIPKTSMHIKEYVKTLGPLARRLWNGASKIKNLAELQFLNIITKTLQGCTKDVQVKMLCSWQDTKCRACRIDRVNEPVRLSCGHFICYNCVTVDEDSSCPACRRIIENVQDIQPVVLSRNDVKEWEAFKTACTSFFLEYLSTFCFPSPHDASRKKDMLPPNSKILYALEKLVICDKRTQKISPNLSTFDTNPTARSYILQLLMRCDRLLVKEQLDHHFRSMAVVMGDKSVLLDIYIQCTQDMLSNRAQALQEDDKINIEFTENLLLSANDALYEAGSQVEHLEVVSNLLYISRIIAESIYLIGSRKIRNLKYKRDLQKLVDASCQFVSNKLVMKQYIIKYLCRRFGIDAFNYTLDNDLYRAHLLPQNLIPDEGRSDEKLYLQFDNFVLAGPIYVRTKNLLFDIAQTEDLPRLLQDLIREIQQAADSVFQLMLALTAWTSRSSTNLELRNETYNYVCQHISMHLAGNVNQQLFRDIREGNLAVFRVPDVSAQMQYKITDLLTMAGMTFLSNGNGLISQLNGLITNSERFLNAFLPTMPCSNYFEVRKVMQLERSHHTSPKAYLCPNGHVYFIGECTNPNQRGVCPDCGKAIGGRAHGLLETGNTAGEITEQSQAGYLLKPANQRQHVIPERSMTKPSVCATRVCLHAAMLLGSRQGNAIQRLIKVGGGDAQVIEFLMCQLVKDLEQLADCIGKSVDDAILLMHQILHQIRRQNMNNAADQFNFATMDSREKWEEGFQRQFLSLVFRDTDRMLDAAQQVIIGSGEVSEKPLHRLVYELNISSQLEDGVVEWSCPALWKYRTHIDLHHLKLRLEAVDENTGGEGAMLKVLLNTEHLSLIQDLAVVLRVQKEFISRYQNKVDIGESEEVTLGDFLGENDGFLEDETNQYILIWNKVRMNLVQFDRYNTLRKHFEKNMSQDSKISMCLPSDRGRGCCALVLAEYLIELQNDILNHALELVKPKPEFKQVEVSDIEPKHLICINEKRDLMPLILANSQYEATVSNNRPQHNITYNLPLLQRKVVEKFVMGKRNIKKETIPRMSYPQDVGLGKDCEIMKEKTKQVALPAKLIQSIDTSMKNARKADICEAVRYVTLVIQLLAKLGGEAEQTICVYAESELLLLPDETALIPRSAKISHCFALYERLSWHRAAISVRIGQNPFQLVSTSTATEMSEELETQLGQVLQQMKNVEVLQFELNSLMMVGPELQEDWSLRDVLFEYIDGKYDDPDTKWCEAIPAEVCVKHSQQVFALSMKFLA